MPTILNILGFRFFFYSNEGNEPPHIHVEKGEARGKYWLLPTKEAYMEGFNTSERRKVSQIVEEYQDYFKKKWDEYFDR